MLVYGHTPVTWVRRQLAQGRKILSQRDDPLVGVGPGPGSAGRTSRTWAISAEHAFSTARRAAPGRRDCIRVGAAGLV